MLPRRLYKILPYLYIITGIVSAMLIHSSLVIIASLLMIMAGVIIISLRISNRRGPVQRRANSEGGHIGVHSRYLPNARHRTAVSPRRHDFR